MALYAWGWGLVVQHRTDDISIGIPADEPLLIHPEIEIDLRADVGRSGGVKVGQGGWLPLWVIKSVLMSLLEFGLEWGAREMGVEYEETGDGGRGCWGYVTRGRGGGGIG